MTSNLKLAIALVVACFTSTTGFAETKPRKTESAVAAANSATPILAPQDPFGPTPSPHDSRNVTFVYEGSTIYNLFAQAGQFLQLILAPDEEIVTIQASDRVRWQLNRVEESDVAPRIFIKPTQTGLVTTIAVVTAVKGSSPGAERVYDLRLESTPEGGKRYQRVQFSYPQVEAYRRAEKQRAVDSVAREDARLKEQELTPAFSVESLNWDYSVSGNAKFKPVAVFDDGKFTWLKMPAGEEWPAVFMGDRREAAMVKTTRRGEYLVVQRLVDQLLLKIDDAEVQIRKGGKSSGWFGKSR